MDGRAFDGEVLAAAAPLAPLGPFEDSLVAWAEWVTLMGFVGVVALALFAAGPAARQIGPDVAAAVTRRLARVGAGFGLLAIPAVLTVAAYDATEAQGYDYPAAWARLYDGSVGGLLTGLEITLIAVGFLVVLPLVVRSVAAGPARTGLLTGALVAGIVALSAVKFPSRAPEPGMLGRSVFSTAMWMLHLWGGAIWIGGLIGLLALTLSGGVPAKVRGAFWSPTIRRFSISAMVCVGAVTLSGLFLYWGHVDSLDQLFTTTYGRVLGVKILLFGAMLLLGMANQFWLHPRIEALRAAGDDRPLRVILVREFPVAIAVEVLLAIALLLVAPFLHGSARNQAFQAEAAKVAPAGTLAKDLPKAPPKTASATTWAYGTVETLLLIAVMVGGHRVSRRVVVRRRAAAVTATEPAELVDA